MYEFQPMTAEHLPLVKRWLAMPHVSEWWHEPEEQFGLITGDLEEPAMDQYIVVKDDRPFAYLQCYDVAAWNSGFGPQPQGTRGIDQFIGETDMLGCGHGSAFVRTFVDGLLAAGTPRIVTDPDVANLRAVRAYEKAGFRRDHMIDTPDGPALLMVRDA
jgi:aminoglycoside 6'-N-acetyltransferase